MHKNVKSEEIEGKFEELENKLEMKNEEVESLQNQLKDVKNEFAKIERKMEEVMMRTQKNQEQGLRDLPFEMVCAFKEFWDIAGIVNYDRITVEFNNSDRPGGADGTVNIETGVFTTVTSGYYIITFSTIGIVSSGGEIAMWLYHNGVKVEESLFQTRMEVGDSGNYIYDQGSRTAVSIAVV